MAFRTNHFDFLRLIFAVLVLYSHSFALVQNGAAFLDILNWTHGQTYAAEIAVNGFFLISGFLITMSWTRSKNAVQFFKKRVLRIYPGFIGACLVCALVVSPLGAASPAGYATDLRHGAASFVRGVLTLGQLNLPPVFLTNPQQNVNGSLWTIRIEFECYLLVPLFMGLLGAGTRRGLVLGAALAGWAGYACVLLAGNSLFPAGGPPESLVSHTQFAVYFLLGMSAYLFRDKMVLSRRGVWISLACLAASAAGGGFNAVLPLAGSYLLFCFAFNQRVRVPKLGRGMDLSYGLYLYGWPVQQLLVWYNKNTLNLLNPYVLFVCALPIAALLAAGSWFFIERPFLRLRGEKRATEAAVGV